MAKTDLSAAITLVKQRPDVRYSNIGNIVRELTQMGFDPKTAKMAVMMVFQDGPEVTYLKSSNVNALKAAEVMFRTNIDLGQILDALLEMGYTREDASNAIDMLNTDEGSQSVNQHTDIQEGDDNAFADYADPGYKYDDVPPAALQELLNHAESNRDEIDSSFIRTMLEKHNVSSQSIQQLINELFGGKTSNVNKTSVELSWRELGLTLQDKGISQDQIIEELKRAGATDEEAHAASLPREQGGAEDQGDEGYPGADLSGIGPESDAPEDLDMGPSGDFPYGAGMGDEGGPGGINDSLEGAPGPNDFEATGGGFIGGPEDTEDGQFFTEGQDSGQAPEMGSDQDLGYWGGRGQDFVSNDPQMTKTDLVQILQNEGASEEEANQVAENLELEDDPAINPGTIVRASGNTGEVTGVWDTLYGKMASVKLENGGEYEFPIEDLQKVRQDKLADTRDELLDKIAAHLSGDWYDALEALPEDYRNTYSQRIKAATKLQREVHNRISTTKDIAEMGLLGEAKVALANEIVFCQTRLASADFVGEDEYVNSLPKYEFGKEAAGGYAFGPGGGESIVLIAAEMEEELEATNWNEFARIASVEFVSDISPVLIGDGQEVARLATTFISSKVSALPAEKAQEIANEFLANVEKVRRSFATKMRSAGYSDFAEMEENKPYENIMAEYKELLSRQQNIPRNSPEWEALQEEIDGYKNDMVDKGIWNWKDSSNNTSENESAAEIQELINYAREGMRVLRSGSKTDAEDGFRWDNNKWEQEINKLKEEILLHAEDIVNAPLSNFDDLDKYIPGASFQIEQYLDSSVAHQMDPDEMSQMAENEPDDFVDRFAASTLFETIDEIDDMQEEAEDDEKEGEEKPKKKKSNTEISDEGWLL